MEAYEARVPLRGSGAYPGLGIPQPIGRRHSVAHVWTLLVLPAPPTRTPVRRFVSSTSVSIPLVLSINRTEYEYVVGLCWGRHSFP